LSFFPSTRSLDSFESEHENKFLNGEGALNFEKTCDMCLLRVIGGRNGEGGDDCRLFACRNLSSSGTEREKLAGPSPCPGIARSSESSITGDCSWSVSSGKTGIPHLRAPREECLFADACERGLSPPIAPKSTNCGDVSGALGNDWDGAPEDIVERCEAGDVADSKDGVDRADRTFGDNPGADDREAGRSGVGRRFL